MTLATKDDVILQFRYRMNCITKSIKESAEKQQYSDVIADSTLLEHYMIALRWLETEFEGELTEENLLKDMKYYWQYKEESIKFKAQCPHAVLMEKIYLETGMLPVRNFYKEIEEEKK